MKTFKPTQTASAKEMFPNRAIVTLKGRTEEKSSYSIHINNLAKSTLGLEGDARVAASIGDVNVTDTAIEQRVFLFSTLESSVTVKEKKKMKPLKVSKHGMMRNKYTYELLAQYTGVTVGTEDVHIELSEKFIGEDGTVFLLCTPVEKQTSLI